ncbi:formate/nitrite transporter family protein [Actinomyces sp. B33]|uniref:formate/nitrite transporter family protein n=1 Tax=Actinomyces sp. B33 TaxID=2942131 RepID=UPI0023425D09|nr:formate/nitrite transporter family protein [Actinomyces sp. B33]MDC4233957.1 formate/nitrite transporter family protein [Actinomyces sp. B33]
MRSLTANLDYQSVYAVTRTGGQRRPLGFLVASMLGGAYIGLADIFMIAAAGPLKAAHSPWAPLINGAVFGIGLILCVFAGGELATSAMMTYTIGAVRRSITWARAAGGLLLMLGGNLVGSVALAGLVRGSGIAKAGTDPGTALAMMIEGKGHYGASELFFRGILCNILVCLAIWCVTRTDNEMTKIVAMAWCLAAFVGSGFEHVVANMTTFSLGIMHGVDGATLVAMARNLLLVGAGNIVGGAVFVAAAYLVSSTTEDGAAEAKAEYAARTGADAH